MNERSKNEINEIRDRAIERAAEAGLIDIAYTETDSPFGMLTIAATELGIIKVGLPNQALDDVLEDLADRVSPRILAVPKRFDLARRQLDLYFDGQLQHFDLGLDWRLTSGFRREVLRHTAEIPYGETLSYAEVAAEAGSPLAHRAAGSALASNPIPIIVPCHRVLRSGGGLGGFGGGLEMKRGLLALESGEPQFSLDQPA